MNTQDIKKNKTDPSVDAFLNQANLKANEDAQDDTLPFFHAENHKSFRVLVSNDRLEAKLEGVFAGSTLEEIDDALVQAHIRWGIDEQKIHEAMDNAQETGHVQRNVVVAKGKPAIYKQRKQVAYPFLDDLKTPDNEPVHLASSVIRKISDVMRHPDIERVRAYAFPVVMVEPGDVLMQVTGEDVIEVGYDVYGKEIKRVSDEDRVQDLKAGDGVEIQNDGALIAGRFGYVSVSNHFLKVLSPIWISPTNMEAYFVNPPALGKRPIPTPETVKELIEEEGICLGVDETVIASMCKDLSHGRLREACVRIAHGEAPNLSKGQTQFHFELLPETWFERLKMMLQGKTEPELRTIEKEITAVSAGQILAQVATKDGKSSAGRDLFGCPINAAEESAQSHKTYKAGPHVRREVADGQAVYISEIYGYPGVIAEKLTVVPPLWLSPDRMGVYFAAFSPEQNCPTQEELMALLELGHIRFGILQDVVAHVEEHIDEASLLACVAKGQAPEPGVDGKVELLYKQTVEAGKVDAGDKMDFREREGVPQARPKDLLARRSFPTPGKPGKDVRGRLIPAPKNERGILYAGHQVVVEEDATGQQLFYATGMGLPRVIKDTLSVLQLYQHKGDVDYRVGNIKMEGDVAIEGSVKNRFRVEATGNIYIDGGVDRSAQVVAGGNIIVKRGIVGAEIQAKGSLSALYVQESKIHVETDLHVRNYITDSRVVVYGRAVIQGDDGGQRQLCLLGGELFAGKAIDATSLGSPYGRETGVMTGIDLDIEKECERYKKGLAFGDLQMRRVLRGLGGIEEGKLKSMLSQMSPNRKKFVLQNLHELNKLRKLRTSLTHYLKAFEEQQEQVAANAFIRVHLSAFQKVSIQIRDRHITLDNDIQKIVFRLDSSLDTVVCEPIA